MKSRIMKVVGVLVALTTIASMLVISVPTNAAAPGALAWTVTDTPGAAGNVLVGGNHDAGFLGVSDNGLTVFVWDTTAGVLYKSTNAGVTFTARVGAAGNLPAASPIVAMAVSPKFSTDNAVVLVETKRVWLSVDGGTTFLDVANADLNTVATKLEAADNITSVALGYFYADNTLSILIGAAGGAGATTTSNVMKFKYGGFSWDPVGLMNAIDAGATNFGVFAVAFSPAHLTDAEILAVVDNAANVQLISKFGALPWSANTAAVNIVATGMTGAVIAVGSDYNGTTTNTILVGTRGNASDGVYRVTGRSLGVPGAAVKIGTGFGVGDSEIATLVVGGPIATATVVAGVNAIAGSAALYRTAAVTGTVTWTAPTKSPTGTVPKTSVAFAGTDILAATTGADSAVSRSKDAGVTFDQISLIDVNGGAGIATMAMVAANKLAVVDANTMFLVMNNTAAGYAASNLFKTTDAGVTWSRIASSVTTGFAAIVEAAPSPAYATDSTLYVSQGAASALVMKSTNGGASFSGIGVAQTLTAIKAVDGTNFVAGTLPVGAVGGFFKSSRFANATGVGASNVFSIAFNPKDATKATIAIGLANGTVYQSTNDGVAFARVGTAGPAAANVTVAYGPDGTLYAADSAGGLFRWSGTAWSAATLQAGLGTGLAVANNGALYMADATVSVVGVSGAAFRTLKPTAATAALMELQSLNYAASGFPTAGVGGVAVDLDIVSGTADNTLYVVETTTAAGTYGYTGRIYGFKDTLAFAPAPALPADKALLTTVTTATVSWTAVTGALTYAYVLDGAAEVATAVATPTSAALAGFTGGTAHTWSFRVTTPLFSLKSADRTFTTALPAVVPVGVTELPKLGGVDVSIDGTFTWPAVAGATGYEFAIAEDLGETDKFAIIDYSATTVTAAFKGRENLKYNTTYYWRVRPFNATTKGDWVTFFFTTMKKPADPVPAPAPTPPVVIQQNPTPEITLTIPAAPPATVVEPIPTYLLWAVIAVGAVLVIAVIVLIVRTRRIS